MESENTEDSCMSALTLREGLQIETSYTTYSFVKYIGEGVFGKVALLKDLHNGETVVVKILKKNLTAYTEKEIGILETVNALGPDEINVVRFINFLDFAGHDALVFEKLDIHFYELLHRRDYQPLTPSEIRPIAEQMLVALNALKGLGIIHTDIKPDNILMVSAEDQPFKVKLIDFGNAIYGYQARLGKEVQAIGYRAPEVFLGLPFNEAVDMWGLGCVLAFLYLGDHLFPYGNHYQMMKAIVELLGVPKDHQLWAGIYTRCYFTNDAADHRKSRLLTPAEFAALNKLPAEDWTYDIPGGLDGLVNFHPDQDDSDLEDRRAFVDLLKGMLRLDRAQRLTPSEALQHPFIKNIPLGQHSDSGVDLTKIEGPSGTAKAAANSRNFQPSPCSWESTGVSGNQQWVDQLETTEPGSLESFSEAATIKLCSSPSETSVGQVEDHAAASTADVERPLSAKKVFGSTANLAPQMESEKTEDSCMSALTLREGLQIETSYTTYSFVKYIGEGVFGKVALLKDLHNGETVVVKILKKSLTAYTEKEIGILETVNALGPDKINVVRFINFLDFAGHDALVFEKLDIHFYELLHRRDYQPLTPSEIRPIAEQMLVALNALKGLGIIHTDIKPDNILMVSAEDQPFKVKLIDFGNATYVYQARLGKQVQALGYRAPEVFLGLPFNEAVDMWGLGCVLAFLYLGDHLFPYGTHYQMMKAIVELLGVPKDHQLRAGIYTRCYFTNDAVDHRKSRLLTRGEYVALNKLPAKYRTHKIPGGLDGLVNFHPDQDDSDLEDRRAFVDLLKGMLHLDGAQRLTPGEALQHPFIKNIPLGQHSDIGVDLTKIEGPSGTAKAAAYSQPSPGSSESTGVSGTQQGVDNISEATVTLSSSNSLESFSEAATIKLCSSPSETSVGQAEDHAAASTPDPESPPSAKKGKISRAFERVRGFFKGIQSLFCCCFKPDMKE